jgi:hypothetical protein
LDALVDGKPTLAFEAKKYREADDICHQEWLRSELGQQKSMTSHCAAPTQT